MSTSYREDCNRAKAAREGIVEQCPVRKGAKKDKPIIVEYCAAKKWAARIDPIIDREWRRWGSYRTVEEAEKMIAGQKRKHDLFEFRIKA
ncbi:hypothetical protein WM24_23780 [Burkholderia ubonensis]|uniref:hypothetical protein n=1 Tax=Burkholderia ubonensis TaxID=101571 RepID=UPI00075A0169|nr:hypothetical protein [Burkholderia ubonensis]KWN80857.1 hypothetical protein WM24_23780 [Burkholderia ubonensis]